MELQYNKGMKRSYFIEKITTAFQIHPIVAILGPRQCGKTTLAKDYIRFIADPEEQEFPVSNYFDLEHFTDVTRLSVPELTLQDLNGLIVIDEVQKIPELFQTLRVMVDNYPTQRYLILGSASRELIRQSSESLAGRIHYIELTPFTAREVPATRPLWLRGGFPKAYLADTDYHSFLWRESYVQTFLEQDIPNLGFNLPAQNLRRFWNMLAHYHGNICNYSELASALQLSSKTVRYYSDILHSTFLIRQLYPWHENISKRQVKSHKIYFRDSGILHTLLGVKNEQDLFISPKIGASWEGFMLEEVIRLYGARPQECFFWATQSHAELDLLIVQGTTKLGFEFKYTDKPQITKSMRIALDDLKLDRLTILYPGNKSFYLDKKIFVTSLESYIPTSLP